MEGGESKKVAFCTCLSSFIIYLRTVHKLKIEKLLYWECMLWIGTAMRTISSLLAL